MQYQAARTKIATLTPMNADCNISMILMRQSALRDAIPSPGYSKAGDFGAGQQRPNVDAGIKQYRNYGNEKDCGHSGNASDGRNCVKRLN
jgi:hypothetical protein